MSVNKKLTDDEKKEYNLTFAEALDALFNKEGFVVGTMFKKGVYLAVDEFTDAVMVKEKTKDGYKTTGTLIVSRNIIHQRYKVIVAATDKLLGLED